MVRIIERIIDLQNGIHYNHQEVENYGDLYSVYYKSMLYDVSKDEYDELMQIDNYCMCEQVSANIKYRCKCEDITKCECEIHKCMFCLLEELDEPA